MSDETGQVIGFPHGFRGDGHGDVEPPCDVEPRDYPNEGRGLADIDWNAHGRAINEKDPELSQAAQGLYKAALLIDGDRHNQHGDRHVNFGTIATFWTVLFGVPIEPWKVGLRAVLPPQAAPPEESRCNK